MGGGGPLSPDFPAMYKFFNSTLNPHKTAGLTAALFFFFAMTTYDRTPVGRLTGALDAKVSHAAITPKDLQ